MKEKISNYILLNFQNKIQLHATLFHESRNQNRDRKRKILKQTLCSHKKYDCGLMLQFSCKICGRIFKWKSNLNRHVSVVHLKTNLQISKLKHNCVKCSRSYTSISALHEHQCLEYAAVKPQFTCDHCGHTAKEKFRLAEHISLFHLKKYFNKRSFKTYSLS